MTEEQKERYKRNREIRAAAAREKAERRQAVRCALEDIIISENTSKEEKLEVAHLLVELSKSYY